jgi:hypothetical protein
MFITSVIGISRGQRTVQERQEAQTQGASLAETSLRKLAWIMRISFRGEWSISLATGQAPEQVPHW